MDRVVLAIHGGIRKPKTEVPSQVEAVVRADMERALQAGLTVLRSSGSALDVVEAAVRVLENAPLLNAGKGSVFTRDGTIELDAAIMNGQDLRAGAIAGATGIKNPITAARAVMEKSEHVFLIGAGAESFARSTGIEFAGPEYFWTAERWSEFEKHLAEVQARGAHDWGTVGAVACDRLGNLAAGTSTGGMTYKLPGRVGDTPVIGAGTYADNTGVAVSATGHGEFFIRFAVAHEINALVRHRGMSVGEAAGEVIQKRLKPVGGEGGVIVLDREGHAAAVFNTTSMYRGFITEGGVCRIELFR